jgi:UDP-N-acetylglucosamine transferase subunit ALG13
MLELGWQVTLAGEGSSLNLLVQEFPKLPTLALKGYRISYPKQGFLLIPKLIAQLPKIAQAIRSERTWLKQAQKENQWDLIISDNRYGLSLPGTKCIFITHQIRVLSGWGSSIDKLLNKQLHRWIKAFDQCWIPDEKEKEGIAGLLSHPPIPSCLFPITYIGPLSRLTPNSNEGGNKILVLLSGPEPQRTLLEEKIVQQISTINEQFLLVRGLPNTIEKPADTPHIQFENHLSARELSIALTSAKLVICRSGYSSIMDLLKFKKKAIVIPTPGQTEQLYLAQLLAKKNWFLTEQQADFQLNELIPQCLQEEQVLPNLNFDLHKQVLAELVTK